MILYASWLVLAASSAVVAQAQSANCTDNGFNWMFNSKGQSPCNVAELLAGQCDSQGFNIPPLPASDVYFGPSNAQANNCQCTSVFYSLLSGCAACQDRSWLDWTAYTQNCSQVFLTVYWEPIPADTSVPNWAYLNVSATNGSFSISAAENAVGPESSAVASATGSASTSKSTSGSSHSSKSNAGAIAGGVVGGVVGATLIAALAFLLYKKGNNGNIQRIANTSAQTGGREVLSSPPPSNWSTSPAQPMYQPALPKPYNPDDPSTFPPAREQPTPMNQMLTGTTYNADPNWSKTGQYTGVPEV